MPFIGPQSCGYVYTQGLYGPAHIPWRFAHMATREIVCVAESTCVCDWRHELRQRHFSGPYQQSRASRRRMRLATASIPCTASRKMKPQWQLDVSTELCVCEWHVSLILLKANLIALHIIFIFQKQRDNYVLMRYWHSLEKHSISWHKNRLDLEWHTQTTGKGFMLTHINT